MTHNYYICYAYESSLGIGFESVEISYPKQITSIDDIRTIEDALKKNHDGSTIKVINWQLFEKAETIIQ